MATVKRPRAVMKINRKKTASVVSRANAMDNGMGNSAALYTAPNPPLNTLQNQVNVVLKCEIAVATRVKGAAAARNVQRGILVSMMDTETAYVQSVVDNQPTYDAAVSAIEAAGLVVAGVGTHLKPPLGVSQDQPGGPVLLDAYVALLVGKGRGKSCFNWQYTLDGGKTFVTLPPTPKSKTTVAGLTALTTVGFRVAVTPASGVMGEWSQIVSFLVR